MSSYTNGPQFKFLKYLLGLKLNCSNMAVIGELGEFPLMLKAWVALVSFWHRITCMADRTLVKKAVDSLMENDIKDSQWISTVRTILRKIGLERYFVRPSLISTEKLKEEIIKRFQETFTQEWSTSLISQTGSLRFYKTFKLEFGKEK